VELFQRPIFEGSRTKMNLWMKSQFRGLWR